METAFRLSKERIIELIVEGVASFDVDLVTCLSPDYSKQGMGWILQQKTCSCPEVVPTCCADGWRLVLAGGHFCNQAEQNYSPIEGEVTAVARGLHDTKYYTMGCKQLYVATDHKSLLCVLGDQSLADVENPRLARIKEKTLWWQFTIAHTPGKLQLAADALSRRKTKLPAIIYQLRIREPDDEITNNLKNRFEHHFPEPDTSDLTEEETASAYSILSSEEISVITWERLYEVANEDRVLVKLKEVVLRGFPQSSYDVDEELRHFHKFKHDLHVAEELVCYKDRIIIPVKLRQQVLETIYAGGVRHDQQGGGHSVLARHLP
jgi:hypothetical protein